MIRRPATESPTKSGLYFCEVDRLGNKYKDVLWYSVDASAWLTGCTPDKLVEWYDEGEESQETVWDEALNLFYALDGGQLDILSGLKSKYTIYRK